MTEQLWLLNDVSLGSGVSPRLRGISLEIGSGVTAVIGYSGAGKTSLLNLLVGFEAPDSGAIQSPRSLFWVPQNGGLWPQYSVREHLELVRPDPVRAAALLTEFDLADRAAARPDELSEGEQSRLSIARSLITGAPVLVMDEPLAHVDPARTGKYWRAIRRHLDATRASLIFSTHSPDAVIGEAESAICLRDGRVLYSGAVDELYWRPASPELAECLGPMNWVSAKDAKLWLGLEVHQARGWRPEQLTISESKDGPLIVESARFFGSVAEAELQHKASGAVRRFFHRPAMGRLPVGSRVLMQVLSLILLFALAGCQKRGETLAVRSVHSWILPAEGTLLPAPRSVAIGKNDEFALLDTAGRVIVYNADGSLLHQWFMPDTKVGKPEGICILSDGRIVVCDTHYHRIVCFDSQGKVVGEFGKMGNGPGEFIYPVGIAKDDRENLYICEYGGNDRVQEFTHDGVFVRTFGSFGTGLGQFQRPSGLCWVDGKLYVADAVNSRILIFTEDGKYEGILGTPEHSLPLQFPYGIARGGDGALYIIEYGGGRLTKAAMDGRLLGQFGSTGPGDGQFATPWGIAIDSKMRARIADTKNRRIVTCEL